MSDLTQMPRHPYPDVQGAKPLPEGPRTMIEEAEIVELRQRVKELEESASHNPRGLSFLDQIFGEHVANLLSRLIQDSIALIAMTIITIVSTHFLKFLFTMGGDDFDFVRFMVMHAHEAVVTLGLLALLCRWIRVLWDWFWI